MDWRDAILLCCAAVAVYTDLRYGLIKNWLTIPLFAGGIYVSYLHGGLGAAFTGIVVGMGIAYLTNIFSTPGGGDIKLGLAVGPWVGPEYLSCYLIGAWGARVFLSLLVRLKTNNWNPVSAAIVAATEMKTWQLTPLGENNFRIFKNAAQRAGGDPDLPAVPGALWVTGGIISFVFLKGGLL